MGQRCTRHCAVGCGRASRHGGGRRGGGPSSGRHQLRGLWSRRGGCAPEDAVRQSQLNPQAGIHKEVPHSDVPQCDPLGVAVGKEGQELVEDKLGLYDRVLQRGRTVGDHVKHREASVREHKVEGML